MAPSFKRAQPPRFRLMPLTIGFMALMFFTKSIELYTGTQLMLAGEAFAQAKAEDAPKETADAAKKDDEAKKEEAPTEETAKDSESAAPEEEKQAMTNAEKAATAPVEDPLLSKQAHFSPTEVDILQSLSARRNELNKWEEDIKLKENLLQATEVRLDRKVNEIQTMEEGLKKLLAQYDEHEETEIRSLVKIYENMKPKDAAEIFNEMELPILVLVVDKMSERKAAAVLALMNPTKAKNLTIELADQRKVRGAMTQQSMSAPPPAPPVPKP